MGPEGLEPVNVTKRNGNELCDVEDLGGAESGALGAEKALIDADLAAVIDAWPRLPKPVKVGIVATVTAVIESP